MLRTKKDVDRHVKDIFQKLTDEKEKALRCFKIAELYYNVNDYETARRFLPRYMEIRQDPRAHKLMGQILEALGQKEAALVHYKLSFELDAKQEDLILKICKLLAEPDVGIDVNRAKYWIERADSLFPRHKLVFQLKEKVLSIEKPTNNEEDLKNLILAELAVRPTDVLVRVKLIKHYIDKNKFEDAFRHASDIEGTSLHRDSLIWYQTLCDLFLKFKNTKQMNWSFWILYISSLERYAALAIKEQGCSVKKTAEVIQAVYNFDQHLFEAKAQSFTSYPSLTEKIFEHMWGQLHFHLACLLLLNSKHDQGSWRESGKLCAPLLLTALHVKPIDLTASWSAHVDNPIKNQLQLYYKEGSFRCSQAGHILLDYSQGNQKKLMSNVEKLCSGSWRERMYQRIFVGRIYQKVRTSYFTNNNASNFPLRFVSQDDLKRYDEVAEEVWPYSLHHQIWPVIKRHKSSMTHMNHYEGPQPSLSSHLFPDLPFTVFNVNNPAPATLCRLDIDAFLNAAALCAAVADEEQQRNTLLNPEKLPSLPAGLTNPLCNEEQEKWWSTAVKIYRKDTSEDSGTTRQTLQRGLEVVRCIGNHGLHPIILVHLARVFQYRAKQLKEKNSESSDISALESRSELYWSAVVPLLERLQNNQTIRMSNIKLFEYVGKPLTNMQLTHAIDEGKLLLAQKLVKDKLYEQAIEALQALKCPEASFEQGKIYKKLADESINSLPKENVTSEIRSQHIIVLSKARNCFYLTLDRLRSPDADPKHPLNAELCPYITAVENELKRIDPDTYSDRNRNNIDDFSEESYSSAHSEEHQAMSNMYPVLNNTLHTPVRNSRRMPKTSSTPRYHHSRDYLDMSQNRPEARPSPERLEALIRQLVHSVDSLKEQNREQHRAMISKLDELVKTNSRNATKEAPKARFPPQNATSTMEEELYGYEDDEYNNYNTTPVPSIPNAPNRMTPAATTFQQNLLAVQRQMYQSPMVYPPINPQNFFLPGHSCFADSTTSMYAANAAAIAAAAAAAYPRVPPLYRTGLEQQQSIGSMQQMTENMQQSLFSQKFADYAQTQHLPQQQLESQLSESAKNEQSVRFAPTNDSNLPDFSMLNIKENSVSTPSQATSTATTTGSRGTLPVNVVITTSDTMPTTTPTSQPALSVTIPAHHRLGVTSTTSQDMGNNVPHSYQISLPSQPTVLTTVNLPALSTTLTMTSPMTKTSVTDHQNTSILSTGSRHSASDVIEVEHDPIPDFTPIIPLPDEVPVTTGEENETTLFCARAKLFRFSDKEWKERGIGNVKLLKSLDGRVRLVMRREQVHKICANHMLRKDMELSPMPNNDKAYVWVANDFADEEVRLEKLCIKFKTAEEAANFKKSFDQAKENLPEISAEAVEAKTTSEKPKTAASTMKVDETKKLGNEFGGFTFTSTPVIQKPVEETKQQQPTAKPGPFASFSFGKTSEAVSTPSFVFGAPSTGSSLAAQTESVVKASEVEANEIVVLKDDAELMHLPSSTKIWNNKGKGVAKVLKNSVSGKIRLLVNTEDDSKTLFNEDIPETLVFNVKNDQVIWVAGTKTKSDSYLLKFKNYEQALLFRTTVDAQKSGAKLAPSNSQKSLATATSTPSITKTSQSVSKNLSELFKPPADSWECHDCYTRNNGNATTCVACQGPAPGATTNKPAVVVATPASSTWSCKKCKIGNDSSAVYCVSCDEPKDPSMPPKPKTTGGFNINAMKSDTQTTFSFGIPSANQQPPTVASKDAPSGFSFNFSKPQTDKPASSPIPIIGSNKTPSTPNTGFTFSLEQPKTPPTVDSKMTFGSPGKSFDFQFHPKTPQSPDRAETSEDEQVEESEDIYFAPVIPLPEKIKVKTGEEDEEILYCHRAKLFKFDTTTKEWKERGLGDIKLLKHIETKKLRLVMRRDQVLKLCLNHVVSSAIEITPKDVKTWMWSAGDYSEGEVEYIQFACRFKSPEIAGEFKKAVDDACKAAPTPKTTMAVIPKAASNKKEPSEEIEIVFETKVTPEEKAAALKLHLPENFYSYKYKDDCPGCLGCHEPDQPLLKPVDSKLSFNVPIFGGATTLSTNSPFGSMFGKTTNTMFGQMTNKLDSKDTGFEGLNICSPSTKQQTPATSATNIFANSFNTTTPATTSSTNVFGGFSRTNLFSSSTNMFSGSSLKTTSAAPVFNFSSPSTTTDASTTTTTTTTTTNNIFSQSSPFSAGSTAFGTTNIFGGSPTSTTSSTSLFGNSTTSTTTKPNLVFNSSGPSMFGSTASVTMTTGSIFGAGAGIASATPTFAAGTSIFGSNASATPVFGAATTTATATTTTSSTSIFGTTTTGTSMFGATTTTASSTSIFGTSAATQSATPIFGATTTTSSSSIFGTTMSTGTGFGTGTMFGGQMPLFGSSKTDANTTTVTTTSTVSSSPFDLSKPNFGTDAKNSPTVDSIANTNNAITDKTQNSGAADISFLPSNSSLSFSALAAQTMPDQKPAFKTDPNFKFDGAGSSVFGVKPKKPEVNKTTKKDKDNDDDEDGDEGDENGEEHDPHFEPIIPLPDAIEVRTGEEDEEKMFCHRAKLYRFDQNTKEWKERGTGEMKLLFHAQQGTYRLLLRREQVHKVVCNVRLTSDLEFHTMSTSNSAWVWAAMNYAEPDNPEVEKLAVRFKNTDIAQNFKTAVVKAQCRLVELHNQAMSRVQPNHSSENNQDYEDGTYDGDNYYDNYGESGEDREGEYSNEKNDDDDYDEYDEDDDHVEMFKNRATIYMKGEEHNDWDDNANGNVRVIYDSDIYGVRIVFKDDNNEVQSDTVVCMDTQMERHGTECTWSGFDYAVDPPMRRTLRAVFPSVETSQKMYDFFIEGKECATKADIRE